MQCARCGAANSADSVLCSTCGQPAGGVPEGLTDQGTGPLDSHAYPPVVFAPGQPLGDRYTVVEHVGAGGMGLVYKAIDRRLGKTVALKLIQAQAAARPTARERFRRELALAQQVTHPNVCRVHDLAEVDGTAFITMEYVEGQTLEVLVHSMGHLSPAQTVALGRQICAGLRAIHERGIVHRDLKPANVMVDRLGHVLLMDFGMAYRKDQERLTADGTVFGTLAYLSPEQTRGQAEFRSDVYSMGLILYEMLTGRRPPGDDGPLPLALRDPAEPTPPPSRFAPEVPAALDALVMCCLERDPAKRFGSARELGEALELLESPVTRTAEVPAAARRRAPRRSWLVVGLVAALVAATAFAWWVGRRAWGPGAAPPGAALAVALLPLAYEGPEESAYLRNLVPLALGEGLERSAGLQVAPFATSRTLGAGEDARSAAQQLGVAFVVQGRLAVSGQHGRGALQLRRADGGTVWTREFDGSLAELVQRADRLEAELARALGVKPPVAGARAPAALQAYLEGVSHLDGWDVKANYTRAQEAFARAVEIEPRFAEAYAGLTLALLNEFNASREPALVERAAALAERALELAPGSPEPYVARGLVHVWRGRSVEAAGAFERAAELAPADDSIFRRIGAAYSRAGRHDEAEAALHRAIELRPAFWDNHNALGVHYLGAGRAAKAQRAFQKVVDLRPDSPLGYANVAAALIFAGKFAEAEPVLLAALRIRPSTQVRSNLGLVYDSLGRHEEAIEQFRQVIDADKRQPDTYGNLGDALRHAGRLAEAQKAYDEAARLMLDRLKLDSNDNEARAKLAMYLAGRQDCVKARRHAALASVETRVDLAYYLALAHALCGDRESAVRYARRAIDSGMAADLGTNQDFVAVAQDPRLRGLLAPQPVAPTPAR